MSRAALALLAACAGPAGQPTKPSAEPAADSGARTEPPTSSADSAGKPTAWPPESGFPAETGSPWTETGLAETGAETGVTPSDTATDTAGPPPAPPDPGEVACSADPRSVLRVACRVGRLADLPLELEILSPAAPQTVFSAGADPDRVVARWLRPETDYLFQVRGGGLPSPVEVPWRTGALPEGLPSRVAGSAGARRERGWLTAPLGCADRVWPAVIDDEGFVVAYEGPGWELVPIVVPDPAGGLAALLGRREVRAWNAEGDVVLSLLAGRDLPGPLHHDLYRFGSLTFVLEAYAAEAEDGSDAVLDRVRVFDGAREVALWSLEDWARPVGGPGGGLPSAYWAAKFPYLPDWSHANSVFYDGAGTLLVSLRHLSAVVALVGDPSAPDFGAVRWSVVGRPSAVSGSLRLVAGPDFGGSVDFALQHHAWLDAEGALRLYDNRDRGGVTRALTLSIDPVAGTATLLKETSLGRHCAVQGGAYQERGGPLLATCAEDGAWLEFAADGALADEGRPDCAYGGQVPRYVPFPRP